MNQSFLRKAGALAAGFIVAICIGHTAVFADSSNSTVSSNWAGYVAQNNSYTGVSGTWTIPTITPSTTLTSNATWVGIGGRTTQDLIQAGVYEIANSDGVTYQAWYELLPDDSTPITLTVSPGDSLSVAIVETSTDIWNIVITDNTTNQQFEKTVNYDSSLSSVEWVQERPLVNDTFATLSGFTPAIFSGATAVQNGQRVSLAQTGATMLNLIDTNSNTALAVPSVIGTDGMSFNVVRTSAQSTDSTTSPSTQTIPQLQIIPPFELHRTGRGIIGFSFPFPFY
jgi:hypothetical protein